jgi:hypothetical protein
MEWPRLKRWLRRYGPAEVAGIGTARSQWPRAGQLAAI